MRIGVNFRTVQPGKIGGMEHHVRCLLDAMLRLSDHEYILYVQDENLASFEHLRPRVTLHRMARPQRPVAISEAVRETDPDAVFHPFLFVEPPQLDAVSAVIIPDLRYLHYPEQIPAKILQVWRRRFPESARRADTIFTLSEHSKADIVRFFKVPESKVRVASPAVDPIFFAPVSDAEAASTRKALQLPEKFVYYPADTWPHKNHLRLLKALQRLKSEGHAIPLALSGFPNAAEDEVSLAIARSGLEVIRLGYLPRGQLPAVYRAATALVFPSVFEGWGMPVSEAMASGTPVLCGRATSVPEVAGDAALYFDPFDERDIAAKLRQFFATPGLRESLAAKGPAQARSRTWDQAARVTLEGLETIARPMLEVVDPLPLVSVITPSFNQASTLQRALDSILNQDYPHIECLVLDANSADGTQETLKRYDGRVRWISRKDRGQTDAINQGLRSARGDILCYLPSDDMFLPGAVRKAVAHMVGHPACDLVYGEGCHIDKDDKFIERYPTEPFDDEVLPVRCFICQPAAFWRRRLHDKIGWFDQDMCLHGVMDYEFWMRAADGARIAWIGDVLAYSRLWQGGKTLASLDKWLYITMNVVHRHYGFVPLNWINAYVDSQGQKWAGGGLPNRLATRIRQIRKRLLKTRLYVRYNGWKSLAGRREMEPTDGYADGWMGTTLEKRLSVAAGARRVRIRGIFPAWPMRHEPELHAWADEIWIGDCRLPRIGEFQMVFALPERLASRNEVVIRIQSTRTFVPADHDGGGDDRHLSCKIEHVSLEG